MSLKMQIKPSRVVKREELSGVCMCVCRGGWVLANSGDATNQILLQSLLGASVAAQLITGAVR